jgi:hypothetical protein
MKVTIEVDLKPFNVPNFVREVDETDTSNGIALNKLSPLTLDKMCQDFRNEVFKKAKKPQPPVEAN